MSDISKAKEQLEHVKIWVAEFLNKRPFDADLWESWESYVDWQVPEICHAIDHAITYLED